MTDLERENLQLLLHAMSTTHRVSVTDYHLPQDVMLRYAELLRADERKKCAHALDALSADHDRDYREYARELAADLMRER